MAATSPTNAWAVGRYFRGGATFPNLIEHWDGTAWKIQKSPNLREPPGPPEDELLGVAATSTTNAWAVGNYYASRERTLALHWNGTAWGP